MPQNPVFILARWRVRAGHVDTVLALLPELAAATRREPGNRLYRIYRHAEAPETLTLLEGYADRAALDAHRQSAHFQRIVAGTIVPLLEAREVSEISELCPDA